MEDIILTIVIVSKLFAPTGKALLQLDKVYPLTTVVVAADSETDTVTVEDYNGNLWQFEGVGDWKKYDICNLIMYTNGTETIYDDEIIKVTYNGT